MSGDRREANCASLIVRSNVETKKRRLNCGFAPIFLHAFRSSDRHPIDGAPQLGGIFHFRCADAFAEESFRQAFREHGRNVEVRLVSKAVIRAVEPVLGAGFQRAHDTLHYPVDICNVLHHVRGECKVVKTRVAQLLGCDGEDLQTNVACVWMLKHELLQPAKAAGKAVAERLQSRDTENRASATPLRPTSCRRPLRARVLPTAAWRAPALTIAT